MKADDQSYYNFLLADIFTALFQPAFFIPEKLQLLEAIEAWLSVVRNMSVIVKFNNPDFIKTLQALKLVALDNIHLVKNLLFNGLAPHAAAKRKIIFQNLHPSSVAFANELFNFFDKKLNLEFYNELVVDLVALYNSELKLNLNFSVINNFAYSALNLSPNIDDQKFIRGYNFSIFASNSEALNGVIESTSSYVELELALSNFQAYICSESELLNANQLMVYAITKEQLKEFKINFRLKGKQHIFVNLFTQLTLASSISNVIDTIRLFTEIEYAHPELIDTANRHALKHLAARKVDTLFDVEIQNLENNIKNEILTVLNRQGAHRFLSLFIERVMQKEFLKLNLKISDYQLKKHHFEKLISLVNADSHSEFLLYLHELNALMNFLQPILFDLNEINYFANNFLSDSHQAITHRWMELFIDPLVKVKWRYGMLEYSVEDVDKLHGFLEIAYSYPAHHRMRLLQFWQNFSVAKIQFFFEIINYLERKKLVEITPFVNLLQLGEKRLTDMFDYLISLEPDDSAMAGSMRIESGLSAQVVMQIMQLNAVSLDHLINGSEISYFQVEEAVIETPPSPSQRNRH